MSSIKILIAEDEKSTADNFKKAFLEVDPKIDITIVDNLNDERSFLTNNTVDIILQDVNMPEIKNGVQDSMGGLNLLKDCNRENILTDLTQQFYVSEHEAFLQAGSGGYEIPEKRLKLKDRFNDNFYLEVATYCLEAIKDEDSLSRLKAYDFFGSELGFIENIGNSEMISQFISNILVLTSNNGKLPDLRVFVDNFRNILNELVGVLLKHYPYAIKEHSQYDYFKLLFNSDVASLYAALNRTINAGVHRDQKDKSVDMGVAYHNDQFRPYYTMNSYKSLMYGLLAFINSVKKAIEDKELIESWMNTNIGETIEVEINGVNKEHGIFVHTNDGTKGLIHKSTLPIEFDFEGFIVGNKIDVIKTGETTRGLKFELIPKENQR